MFPPVSYLRIQSHFTLKNKNKEFVVAVSIFALHTLRFMSCSQRTVAEIDLLASLYLSDTSNGEPHEIVYCPSFVDPYRHFPILIKTGQALYSLMFAFRP
jgi:hypothetical protein